MSLSKPHFLIPSGVIDCHFPVLSEKGVTAYKTVCKTLGIERAVLIQAVSKGTDHRLLLSALETLGPGFHATIAADQSLTDFQLAELKGKGVCGIRFNLLEDRVQWEEIEALAKRIEPLGWHIDLLLKSEHLHAWGTKMGTLPVPLIIDHMAMLRPGESPSPLFKLIDRGRCYVKLSAPYRLSRQSFPYTDIDPLPRLLVKEAPERMVWGTDWPHPQFDKPMPDDGALFDLFQQWTGVHTERILVENPTEFYRF